eukprot:TRINITY_DN1452_c0_g1_i3.p1 TRINITY_DN1452_c0_g1~~TRINITY_DN1452_c0_g1_i3.p1  ORF type:complete len:441 (+),score=61.65 TRINITY_DN1452_c0_g1_i3:228-1550(+)
MALKPTKLTVLIVGCMIVAMVSGFPNAIAAIGVKLKPDLGFSALQMNILAPVTMLGLFFTVPAGMAFDSFGALVTSAVGSMMIIVGYLCAYFVPLKLAWLIYIFFGIAGFGSGITFICALSTMIKSNTSTGIALVSACMSISLAFGASLISFYDKSAHCDTNACWRGEIMIWAIVAGVCATLGTLTFKLKIDPADTMQHSSINEGEALLHKETDKPLSLLESTVILKSPQFWILFFAYFAGISSGIFVITQAEDLWDYFTTVGSTHPTWFSWVFIFFPIFNYSGTLISVWISNIMVHNGIPRMKSIAVMLIISAADVLVCGLIHLLVPLKTREESTIIQVLFLALLMLVGLGFGSSFSLFPMLIGEIFGNVNFGKNFGFLQISSSLAAVGTPIVSGILGRSVKMGFVWMYFIEGTILLIPSLIILLSSISHRKSRHSMDI